MQGPPLAGSLAGEQRLLMSVANPPAVLGKPGVPGLGPQRADRQAGPSPGSAARVGSFPESALLTHILVFTHHGQMGRFLLPPFES